ncbi:MAG: PspC domain-containing protein [Woeseia sp.]
MSRDAWSPDNSPLRGLYRDRENGWIFGVCAGIAEFGNFNVVTVRVIAVICLCLFTWATALVYVAATLLIRERPLIYSGRYDEYEFWRRRGRNDRWSHS